MEEGQAILKMDRDLCAVLLHSLTEISCFSPISRLKMKSECFSEKFVSDREFKFCQNTEDQNVSL